MPRHLILLSVVAGVLALGQVRGAAADSIKADLLAEPMVDLEGRPASLADYAGQVMLVNFWASWCAPCRHELPLLDAWHRDWDGQAQVVAVSIDHEAGNAERFVTETGLELPVLVDGPYGLARQLDLKAVPSTYLLDRQGNVVMVVVGSADEDLARLKRAAEDLMAPVIGSTERIGRTGQ